MNRRLEGHGIVVTGAAGTIGREVCRVLLENGAHLTATDLPSPAWDAFQAEAGSDTNCLALNVSEPKAALELISSASRLGRIDAVVNVAGYWEIVDFVDSDLDQWMRMFRANLFTAMSVCSAAVPCMLAQGKGSIVNFASTAGEYGSIRPSAAYAAAKGGVIAFTKSLAREVSPRGVRINAVSPGPIETPMLQAASDEAKAEVVARTIVGRVGVPRDIADGVVYLASDESSYVTGTVLQINGGSLL